MHVSPKLSMRNAFFFSVCFVVKETRWWSGYGRAIDCWR